MKNQRTKGIRLMLFALLIGWTLVIFVLSFWRINSTEQETREIAYIQAKVAQGKDLLYRRWNSNHGGVYVRVTEKTQPNPYLAHIPERDITTPSGKNLTLVNPAYMSRQVNEYEAEISEIRSHLTSLKPVNPKNAPDQWEQKSLEAFETGVKEATIIDALNGQPYYRLIQPFFVEKGCLKCHEHQGYKENDIRGGISISVPMKPLLTVEASSKKRTALIYGFIWVLGIGGVFFSYFKLNNSFKKQYDAEIALEKAYNEVEQKVVERTRELNDEIVGRKLLQETLTISDQYNRMLFDQSVIGLALTRMDGQLVDVNPAYANIIGRTFDETLKLTNWDVTPEKYAQQEAQQLKSLEQTGSYVPYEKEYIHKDGHLVPVRLQGQIIKRNGEKFILSSVEDITDRKLAEEALLASELRYRSLYEHIPVMNFKVDSSGKTISVNRYGAAELGYTVEEIVGKPVLDIFYEEDKPIVLKQLETCFQNPDKIYEWDLRKVNKSGKILWVHEVARIVEQNGLKEIHFACQNITERKRVEDALRHKEEWERLLSAITNRFVNIHIEHIPSEINRALAEIGNFTDVDRSYIFQFTDDGKKMNNTFEWCSEGIEPQIDNLQGLPSNVFPWWMEKLNKHENIIIEKVADLPSEAKAEKDILQSQNIKSLIVLPMVYANSLTGFLGFDSTRKERTWSEDIVNVLRIIGDTIAGITEHKRTEEALLESEEKYKTITESTIEVIFIIDKTGKQLFFNESVERVLGYKVEELTGKSFTKFVPKKELPKYFLKLKDVFLNKEIKNFETQIYHKDGHLVDVELNGRLIKQKGKYVAQGSIRDITKRKHAEEELLKKDKRLEIALEASHAGVWEWDLRSNEVVWSDENYRLLGYEPNKVKPSFDNWFVRIHPEDRTKANSKVAKTVEKKSDLDIELRLLLPDGSIRWINDMGKFVFDDRGNPIKMYGIQIDITERKLAEEALRESERRLKNAEHLAHLGHWELNPVTNDLHWSDEIYRMFGIEPQEFSATYEAFLERVHPDDKDFVNKTYNDSVKNRTGYDIEHRIMLKDGTLKFVNEKCETTYDGMGKPLRSLGAVLDITNRKRAEEESEAQKHFISSVVDTSPAIIYIYDLESNRNVFINSGMERLLGYTSKEIHDMGENVLAYLLHPDDIPAILELHSRIRSALDDDPLVIEYRMKNQRGEWRTLRSDERVFARNTDGSVKQKIGVAIDITARKQAEEEIIKVNRIYAVISQVNQTIARTREYDKLMADICRIAIGYGKFRLAWIGMVDEKMKIVKPVAFDGIEEGYLSAFKHILIADVPEGRGPSGTAIRDEKFFCCNDIATDPHMTLWRDEALKRGYRSSIALPIFVRKKVIGAFNLYASEPFFFDEEEIRLLQEVSNGIGFALEMIETEKMRKSAEEELKLINKELHAINKTIVTSASALDLKLILDRIMEEATQVVGLEGGTICLINPDDTFELAVERGASQETIDDLSNNKIKIGECLCGNCASECKPLILPTKEAVLEYDTREVLRGEDIRFHAAFPFVVGNKCVGVLCVFTRTDRKPTERSLNLLETIVAQTAIAIEKTKLFEEVKKYSVQLEQKVLERTAKLEAANKELEAFSYSVSHDLRAPLRHINGYIDLLNVRYSNNLPDMAKHYLSVVTDASKQMGTLIDDLLQFSRTGRQEVHQTNLNMNELIKEVLEKLKPDFKNRKINWNIQVLPPVYGDYSLLKQVWFNLLDNAVKYTRNKTNAEITVGYKDEVESFIFFVSDNGVGFDMKYALKLFGVFQRLHSHTEFEGTGIGLANVQRIIHKHNGKVWAEAEPNKGAIFFFSLPKNQEE